MIDRKTLTVRANDPHGMTVDEVEAFAAYVRTSGATGTERIKATTNLHQGIKSMTVGIAADPTR